jgi:hypothetical protein
VLAECGIPDILGITHRSLLSFIRKNITPAPPRVSHERVLGHLTGNAPDTVAAVATRARVTAAWLAVAPYIPSVNAAARIPGSPLSDLRWWSFDIPNLADAVIASSFARWVNTGLCQDLIYWRTTSPLFHRQLRHGMAFYLTIVDKPAAVAMARLRFNRNDTADSRKRRGFPEFKGATNNAHAPCTRCAYHYGAGTLPPYDNARHFIEDCPGVNDELIRFRARHSCRYLPFSDTAAMLGEGCMDGSTATRRGYTQHLTALSLYWSHMAKANLTV